MSRTSLQMYTLRDYTGSTEQLDITLGCLEEIGNRVIQPRIPEGLRSEEFKSMLDAHGMQVDSFFSHIETMEQDIQELIRKVVILGP